MQVRTGDVLGFIEAQRQPRVGNVVRLVDGEAGMAASTIKRRLATVSSLFEYLAARGLVTRNPVRRSLSARPARAPLRGTPLVRAPRRLPRIPGPDEVDRLVAALRTDRDKAMVWLMLLGGLRRSAAVCGGVRCWVCGWPICVRVSGAKPPSWSTALRLMTQSEVITK